MLPVQLRTEGSGTTVPTGTSPQSSPHRGNCSPITGSWKRPLLEHHSTFRSHTAHGSAAPLGTTFPAQQSFPLAPTAFFSRISNLTVVCGC